MRSRSIRSERQASWGGWAPGTGSTLCIRFLQQSTVVQMSQPKPNSLELSRRERQRSLSEPRDSRVHGKCSDPPNRLSYSHDAFPLHNSMGTLCSLGGGVDSRPHSPPNTVCFRMGQLHRGFALPCPSAECVSSVGTTWSGQEIGSGLNHSSYGETICLRPGLKPGLCFTAGTASIWTQQAVEKPLQATSLGRPILLPYLPFAASSLSLGFVSEESPLASVGPSPGILAAQSVPRFPQIPSRLCLGPSKLTCLSPLLSSTPSSGQRFLKIHRT